MLFVVEDQITVLIVVCLLFFWVVRVLLLFGVLVLHYANRGGRSSVNAYTGIFLIRVDVPGSRYDWGSGVVLLKLSCSSWWLFYF